MRRRIIVLLVFSMLSTFGLIGAGAPPAHACVDDQGQCVVNCVREVVENGLQARCRL